MQPKPNELNALRTIRPAAFFEPLETRQLLAATLNGSVLNVTGSNAGERIDVFLSSNGSSIVVMVQGGTNDSSDSFAIGGVSRISVNALGGTDTVAFAPAVAAPATIDGGAGHDTLTGGSGDDVLIGGPDNDFLEGKDGNDAMDGGTGADKFHGNAGVDTADYSARTANLTITLDRSSNDGEPNERDDVADSTENVLCGTGNDSVTTNTASTGNISANYFWGNRGNDTLDGGTADDNLNGGEGNDLIRGGTGGDFLDGWNGNDTVEGGENDDTLLGYYDNDVLRGDAGNDWLYGEDQDDVLDGGAGADNMEGGAGTDSADYSTRTENLNVTLDGVANDGRAASQIIFRDPWTGQWIGDPGEKDNVHPDVENVLGGSGNDRLSSPATSNVANRLVGNGGNDVLDGGGGADVLDGGAGDDTLFARDSVADQLFGGIGNDRAKVDANLDAQNSIESTFEWIILPTW